MTDATHDATHAPSILYHGLGWEELRNGSLQAISETTGGRYLVEHIDETLWMVRFGFPERPGKPNIKIGTYNAADIAYIAAERHDYTYWRSVVERNGQSPVFLGSGDNNLVARLSTDGEDITALMVDAIEAQGGETFDKQASFFSATKAALKQERNGNLTLSLTIASPNIPRWMMEAQPGTSLLIGAIDTGGAEDSDWIERGQQALKRIFSLPSDNTFQNWMLFRYDRWKLIAGAVDTGTSGDVEEATSETLRRLLAIPTRKTLTRDRDAIARLEQLDREFYMDMSRGFGVDPT